MKVLITGASGQLGHQLQQTLVEHELDARGSAALDITDPIAVQSAFAQFKPDVVINAAAYTAVDKAEAEPERAAAINHHAVQTLAEQCLSHNARLIHVSTDFVFDGTQSRPYTINDACNPLGVYGKTKHQGELALLQTLPKTGVIIRTSWLYSSHGNNFVKTMLRLMAQRDQLNVVCDQIGTPTCVTSLAQLIQRIMLDTNANGILHWSDAGVASWYDFAVAIYEEARTIGLLSKPVQINPISSIEYPTPAKRPAFSVLDKTESHGLYAMPAVHWRVRLREVLGELASQQ